MKAHKLHFPAIFSEKNLMNLKFRILNAKKKIHHRLNFKH